MYYQTAEESVCACFSATSIRLLLPPHFHSNSVIVKQIIHHIQALCSDPAVDLNAHNENECSPRIVSVLMNKQGLKKLLLQYKDILN